MRMNCVCPAKGVLDGCGGMSSERRAFLWPATTHAIGAENYGGGDGCNNSVSFRRTAWGVGEDSRRREVMRDSFVRGYGRNEAIIHDGRRPGPRGELSPRLASLAVSSAMVVRIRRMTDPKCSKKKKKGETTFAVSPVADSTAGRALIALRPPRVGPIDSIQQQGQLRRTQSHAGLILRHDAAVAPSPPP